MSELSYKKIKQDYILLSQLCDNKIDITDIFTLGGGNIGYYNIGYSNNGYYFVHMTKSFGSLKNILQTGLLKIGSELKSEDTYLGKSDGIFANIFFDDINNIEGMGEFSLILSPDVIKIKGNIANVWQGWGYKPLIKIRYDDTDKIIKHKLAKVKKFVKNPVTLPKLLYKGLRNMHHEVMFNKNIDMHNYLLGIYMNGVDNSNTRKVITRIKKLLSKYKYNNIGVYLNKLPSLSQLVTS